MSWTSLDSPGKTDGDLIRQYQCGGNKPWLPPSHDFGKRCLYVERSAWTISLGGVFYKLEISAESTEDAKAIVRALLEQRLATGGQFIETPSRFLWKGEIVDQNYVTATSFTIQENRDAVTRVVEAVSKEEVPMICFIPFEANPALANWIQSTVPSSNE